MSNIPAAPLKRTPLHDIHVALGAKIVPFAGYEMPVQYPGGITAEHKAVREGCGVFDVSHMGEFWINGARAVDFVNFVTTNDVAALVPGQVHYSTILNDHGTIEDDCLVYRYPDKIMMVVNASNAPKDFAVIGRHAAEFGVDLHNATDDMTLLAVQGPQFRLVVAAPDAELLAGGQRKRQAGLSHRAAGADRLGPLDLRDGDTGRPDREEKLGISGVPAGR